MDTLQAVEDYITQEQKAGMDKTKEYNRFPKLYGTNYYQGYYNGYLTALYNLKVVIAKNRA